MEIKTIEISGLAAAMQAVYLSYNKKHKSRIKPITVIDTKRSFYSSVEIIFDEDRADINLLSRLIRTGDSHAKPLRGIVVWADISAPIYFWYEMETYYIGRQRLMSASTMHTEAKGLTGEELQRVKAEIPMGHIHEKIDYFSYQTLRRIVKDRHDHRLPEWHQFIDWVKTLPFAEELILTGLEL